VKESGQTVKVEVLAEVVDATQCAGVARGGVLSVRLQRALDGRTLKHAAVTHRTP
jgi:hypothetical protein